MLLSTYDNMIARPFTLGHGLASPDLRLYTRITDVRELPESITQPSERSDQIVGESLEDLEKLLSWLYDQRRGYGRQVNAYDVVSGLGQLWGDFHFSAFGKWENPRN
jgi:hypothetical protein